MHTVTADNMHYTALQRRTLEEITALLQDIEERLAAGAQADEVLPALYDENLIVVGDGDETASRGLASFRAALDELLSVAWAPRPQCRYVLRHPLVLDQNAATTLVEFQVRPNEGRGEMQVYRAMYGWLRTPKGWRIQIEMYGTGRV